MDSAHLPEFASAKYFEKQQQQQRRLQQQLQQQQQYQQQLQQQQQQQLQQQQQQQQQQQLQYQQEQEQDQQQQYYHHHHHHHQLHQRPQQLQPHHQLHGHTQPTPNGPLSQPQFILPVRGPPPSDWDDAGVKSAAEQKRHEKSRLFGFRSKFHAKPATSSTSESLERRPSLAESLPGKQSVSFNRLFDSLPNELRIEIIASLPLLDVLNLRLASRSMHALISLNETPIVRYHLDRHIPAYAKRLYPVPTGGALNLHYLCGVWHRLHVAAKLSYLMCEWITKELFLRTTEDSKREFAPQRERMRRRLIPLLFTIFHFFETYRHLHLRRLQERGGRGLLLEPYTANPVEIEVMNMYDDRTLLRVHEVFPLVVSSFCRRLRPPTYVGRVERSLRGYFREKPSEEVHVAILCLGGLRQVERFWEVKGYNTRRAAVDAWYNAIARGPSDNESKKRRGVLGLGRKKSMAVLDAGPRGTGQSTSPDGSRKDGNAASGSATGSSLVYNTSMAAGMPMDALRSDQAKALLSDLPGLHQIWLETAEAMILNRRIVSRAVDIKRNEQVMLALIREDWVEDEDQWWYGTVAPESVRPDLAAIDEDALE